MRIRPAITRENAVVLAPQAETTAPTAMKTEQMMAA